MQHVLTLNDFSSDQIEQILAVADELKTRFMQGERPSRLSSRVLGLLFSKPSLRTRVSFEAGMSQLGGSSLYLGTDVGWGTREPVKDFARVISQYIDVLVCRTHEHSLIEELAQYSSCPVINGLTDRYHPCQALADVMTLRELRPDRKDLKMAYVGDGNNVARSLAIICAKLGIAFSIAAPQGYHLEKSLFEMLKKENPKCELTQTEDPRVALKDASAVYTDVWSSMGFEHEQAQRQRDFAAYQVNATLMKAAPADAIFLHCLPAHRGEEVTADVIDSSSSAIVQQAGNRMHAQKGLLVWLLS